MSDTAGKRNKQPRRRPPPCRSGRTGTYTLEIAYRENGTLLDPFLINDSTTIAPVTLSPMSADLKADKGADFKDYVILADVWLDEQPWPAP